MTMKTITYNPYTHRLVPVEPTEEMHVAACKVLLRANGLDGLPKRMLEAMLSAAPQPEPVDVEPVGYIDKQGVLWGTIDGHLIEGDRPIYTFPPDASARIAELEQQIQMLTDGKRSNHRLMMRVEELEAEVANWKNNHETEVRRARILKERTDVPIERVQAYDKWGEDLKRIAERDAEIDRLSALCDKWTLNAMNSEKIISDFLMNYPPHSNPAGKPGSANTATGKAYRKFQILAFASTPIKEVQHEPI